LPRAGEDVALCRPLALFSSLQTMVVWPLTSALFGLQQASRQYDRQPEQENCSARPYDKFAHVHLLDAVKGRHPYYGGR
jgi:hypothetical protein